MDAQVKASIQINVLSLVSHCLCAPPCLSHETKRFRRCAIIVFSATSATYAYSCQFFFLVRQMAATHKICIKTVALREKYLNAKCYELRIRRKKNKNKIEQNRGKSCMAFIYCEQRGCVCVQYMQMNNLYTRYDVDVQHEKREKAIEFNSIL